jgi:hypothetical protein
MIEGESPKLQGGGVTYLTGLQGVEASYCIVLHCTAWSNFSIIHVLNCQITVLNNGNLMDPKKER